MDRKEVGSRHDLYRDNPGRSAKVNAALPLRQGAKYLGKKKLFYCNRNIFNLFIFNGLCQLKRRFIVSFDTYKLFAGSLPCGTCGGRRFFSGKLDKTARKRREVVRVAAFAVSN
ncbi:hypothetical protein F9K77_02360 [Ochrobactrum sp. LMG 5442]|nr:hypothetical protein F9K77_02360 [Ochrobactrum sp. LMG 5442]